MNKKKIGACMIVKNESAVIARCFDSLKPLIDYILVCDTGSTDDTKAVILKWLKDNQIEGEVIDCSWQNFGYNRSEAVRLLKDKNKVDYGLTIDADEVLVLKDGYSTDDILQFKASLWFDLYDAPIVIGQCNYSRPQLFSTKKDFLYRGVVHEFLDCKQKIETRGRIDFFRTEPKQDSSRNLSGDKTKRDAALIRKALESEKDEFIRARYEFYLAQSLRDSGDFREAIAHYKNRISYKGWNEEIYISLLNIARMEQKLNTPIDNQIQLFLSAAEIIRERAEALYEAVKICRLQGKYYQGYILGKYASNLKMPPTGLFLEKWIYDYALADEYSICAYYVGDFVDSKNICEKLLSEGKIPESYRDRIRANLEFSVKNIKK